MSDFVNNFNNFKKNKMLKREKILEYSNDIKLLLTQGESIYSIAKYIKENYLSEVSHSYIISIINEIKNSPDNYYND